MILIYLQNQQCNAIPNDGKLSKRDNFVSESDTTDDNLVNFKRNMLSKNKEEERYRPKYNNMNNKPQHNTLSNIPIGCTFCGATVHGKILESK